MKLFVLLSLLLALPLQWEPDFENAKKSAKENHQLILLNFSGSDWCGPCMVTKKDYFENEAFLAMAKTSLVLVNADFPRKKKNIPSAEIVKRNEALAEKYNKQGMFPFTLLLDADGKVLKTWSGKPETPPEEWTAEIKAICAAHK
ncbi:thioredoxin family protein [Flavobacterium pallidum]|uniref:Thioredoxin family protein n=1 Tax=Flavobacterium pallidum TaxID=2172098 RepID=A0A2S1SFU2_9FLAO|nr:thioredoxin family protein [Flavobacterium pallidum]AWI25255.1 thioredoxin family protein [Flavobacterium pallidum]